MLSEFVEPKWQRKRGIRKIHVVAVLSAVAAAGVVMLMFNEFGVLDSGPGGGERQLIASVDLRLGDAAGAAVRGEGKARADIEAGLLQLEVFGEAPTPAHTQLMKQRYGLTLIHKGKSSTLRTQAHADAYNGVMRAEIERRHGSEAADALVPPLRLPAGWKDHQHRP